MNAETSGCYRRIPPVVEPLGVFGVLAGQQKFERLRNELRELAGAIPEKQRALISKYLRSGAVVFAIMEYTRDILNGAFGVSGGSGLLTDGRYYWRFDAADYLEHYGVALPREFLEHGDALKWSSQPLSQEDVDSIYRYLEKHVRRLPDL